jgi:hypothetical protein
MPSHVTVNLNVNVNAEGQIEVFGQDAPTISNKVVASFKLPTTSLYERSDPADNSGSSIFEFWEPSDALGTRKARRAVDKLNYNSLLSYFGYYLSKVLTNPLNAINADPFNQTKYANTPEYYTHSTFGRLALSSYAHYLFGHVAATAAITNDADFITTMNKYENIDADDFIYNTSTSYSTESATNANLAKRIVDKIAKLTDSEVLNIVEQVIGQDASRAMGQDNSSISPDVKQPLKFFDGDTIYININLLKPTVSVLNNETAQQGEPEDTKYDVDAGDNDGSLNRNYTIEITLENPLKFPNGINTLGFTDDNKRYNTINFTTGAHLLLANSDVVTNGQNSIFIAFLDNNGAQIGSVGTGPSRRIGNNSAIITTDNLTGFNLSNSTEYNSYYFSNPVAFLYKKSIQNSINMQIISLDSQTGATIPISSMIKISLPVFDFTITGSSSNGTNRNITFTSSRTIPSTFFLGFLKQNQANTGVGTSYQFQYGTLSDGTTLVYPEGSPTTVLRTSQLTIEPNKTYTYSINENFFTSEPLPVDNMYRLVLIDNTYVSGNSNGYIRFGGSYLFGFNSDKTVFMH